MATAEVFPDYYGILGVPRYTDVEGIRRAYLRKAWQHHPDLHPDNPEAVSSMSSINVAYATLFDPYRRANYDVRRGKLHSRPVAVRRRRPVKEPGVFQSALAVLQRLFRYVAATLPA